MRSVATRGLDTRCDADADNDCAGLRGFYRAVSRIGGAIMRVNCLITSSITHLAMTLGVSIAALIVSAHAHAQFAPQAPVATATVTPPEPIYWKQDLFLVPYQWSSAADPAATQAVWLLVSKDRGASWNKISEAKPQVKAFNYRADGEGEYWFAIRTIDQHNRAWPAGPYQPELRVIVDTTMPRIEELRAQALPAGDVEIAWRSTDANLDPNTLVLEWQADPLGAWQPVEIARLAAASPSTNAVTAIGGASTGHVKWQPVPGTRPITLRATVRDRAGNSGTYQVNIAAATVNAGPLSQPLLVPSNVSNSAAPQMFGAPATLGTPTTVGGWQSGSAATQPMTPLPATQPWPATAVSRSPFRLSSVAVNPSGDGVTSYGSPLVLTEPSPTNSASDTSEPSAQNLQVEPRFAGPVVSSAPPSTAGASPAAVTPLTPFRQVSIKRLPTPIAASASQPPISSPLLVTPIESNMARHSIPQLPSGQMKLVGSRTFALEYDLDDAGRWGVTKVELWGTRDGGQTWRMYTRDDDERSPLVATVDEEGLYGFRIVAESAGAASLTPSSGDVPELWVSVDLQRPVIELTAVERGDRNLSDHLIVRWQVADDNLESRPIALFYSSRPAGPWSAIATSLHDTGEYAWRVERHVPSRFYLRAEARDTAGNLSAFQTREPIEFLPIGGGAGHLRSVEPVGPTAVESSAAYR
jgi:hypothetical protein